MPSTRKTNWLPREARPMEPNVKIPCKDSRNWTWRDPSRNELYDKSTHARGNWRNEEKRKAKKRATVILRYYTIRNPSFKAVLFTRAPTLSLRIFEHSILISGHATRPDYPVNDTDRRKIKQRIAHCNLKSNVMVHS